MQRTEAAVVGSYLDADPMLAKFAGTATKKIGGVICLAAKAVDEPFLNRALGVGTIADATPELLERIERHYASIGKPARIAVATTSRRRRRSARWCAADTRRSTRSRSRSGSTTRGGHRMRRGSPA
jgi:hypothetical protein